MTDTELAEIKARRFTSWEDAGYYLTATDSPAEQSRLERMIAEAERLRGLVAYFVYCADERMWPTKRLDEARATLSPTVSTTDAPSAHAPADA